MPFRFTLQGLLRVRETQERAELQGLQALAAQVAAARAAIAALDAAAEQARRAVWEEASSGISGAELHFSAARESARLERRRALHAQLQEREQAQKTQLARYLQARQKRETLAHLRDQQLAAYEREQARQSQRQIDELFLVRQTARKTLENP
jgi:flagellar export protein FliJ